ncbi:MAG: hypothetical protein K2J60_17900 [Acetatifactor sp.]|nr:hypothetical protein [Acetatifactor sp.]
MRKKISGRAGRRFLTALLVLVCLTVFTAGCAGTPAPVPGPEDVMLLEPAGVGESYETAARRDMYDAAIYSGLICPYTEECSLERSMNFDSYAALPGDAVRKGQTLIRTNVDNLERQIADMEKSIARSEEEFLEYSMEAEESLEKYRGDEKFWGQAVENWAKEKPEEDTEEDLTYEKWESDNLFYETKYRNALIGRQKLEEQLRQRTELYQLDAGYNEVLLNRLRQDLNESRVLSKQKGVVTNIRLLNYNDYISAGSSMAAVADPDRRLLKCEFISKAEINSAEQVFAIIGGKRCEVEYQPMESEEYRRLEEKNGKVFTTFYLPEEAGEVELGSYVVVAVIKQVKRDVLSVPKDAIEKGEDASYVYVLKDGERVYTPVMTGMQDGVYVEILSGVGEGDKVLTRKDTQTADNTAVLGMGSVSHEFSQKGTIVYPTSEWISCPDIYGTVYFEERMVDLYQQVKKGDVLFKIRVQPNDVELARKEQELQRQRERLTDLEKQNQEVNKKAIEQGKETIAELEKLVEEMKADFAMTEIRAPYDGIVTDLSWELWWNMLESGDLLQKNQALLMLAEQGSNYIMVEDPNGLLTYGNVADIEYNGADGSKRKTTGLVVTLNQACVSAELFGDGYALIRVSGEDAGDMSGSVFGSDGRWSLSRFDVTVATRKMENVLLVPKKAVTSYGGVTYVKLKQKDGSVLYRSFLAGGSDDKNYWVIEGLTEGMEVCIE